MNAIAPTVDHAVDLSAERTRIDWFAIAAFGLLWVELVSRLRFEWTINPQYGYGWMVPFLAAYLFWRRWATAPSAARPSSILLPALAIAAAAFLFLPIRLVQEANPDWRLLSWAMALAVIAISLAATYLAGGAPWLRHFAFPMLFLLVAVPWPTQFEQAVIQGLMRAVASINVEVLNAIGISAVQMGNVIEVGSGFVGIDEACTGVRSLQSTFMVSLFLGEFYMFSVVRRIILVVAGALLAFFCNLVRTFLLVYVGAERGSDAIRNWHDPAGLTILVACLFGLWAISLFMDRKGSAAPAPRRLSARGRIPRSVVIAALAIAVTAEGATQAWYGFHEARAAKLEPWTVEWPKQAENFRDVPVAEQAKDLLRYNEGGGASWTGPEGHQWTMYFFKWLPGRTAGLFIRNHRPDVCLPASGMVQRGGVGHRLMTVNGVTLPIRAYTFQDGSETYHVFYCYWDGSMPERGSENLENWSASGRLESVLNGKRDVGTQMLEIVVRGYSSEEEAEERAREQLEGIVQRG